MAQTNENNLSGNTSSPATWGAITKVPFWVAALISEKHCKCPTTKRLFFAALVDFFFSKMTQKSFVEIVVIWERRQ